MDWKSVLEHSLGQTFTGSNSVKVLKNGDEIFPAMLEAIEKARHSVELLTFIYWTGNIAERFSSLLARKAKEGVSVKVLLDALGCRPMPNGLVEEMQNAGVNVRWFRPLETWKLWRQDHRTHRKILVCDCETAFTGGVGIARQWEGDAQDKNHWRETHFKIQGDAVPQFRAAFIGNWLETGASLQSFFTQPNQCAKEGNTELLVLRSQATQGWSDVATMFRVLIMNATKRIWISTPYFVPDERNLKLLVDASNRGLDVRILLPGKYTDHRVCKLAGRKTYDRLLKSGATIWHYQKTMFHTKGMIIDDDLALVGSMNFNHRSLIKDDEIMMIVYDANISKILRKHFEEDLKESVQKSLSKWRERPLWTRLKELAVQPVKGQL